VKKTSLLWLWRSTREVLLSVLLVAVSCILSARAEGFRSELNFTQLVTDRVHVGMLAVGMTFVILTAGIDVSVGSMVALSGMAFALAWQRLHCGIWVAALIGLATGAGAGAINGALIAVARVPALIVTLATLSVYRGIAEGFSGSTSIHGFPDSFQRLAEPALGLPLPVWALLAFFVAGGIYLARSKGGRAIYAIGANEAAARLSGVPVRAIRWRLYTLSGLLAGVAALTYAAVNNTFKADVGRGYELDAITVVVLGGTSVAGGEGSMTGTLLALALLAVGLNGMDLWGIPRERQAVVVAFVLVLSLWIDGRLRARRGR
jgi:rhamnose transport system permease protein